MEQHQLCVLVQASLKLIRGIKKVISAIDIKQSIDASVEKIVAVY
jgi:hypothetical protein